MYYFVYMVKGTDLQELKKTKNLYEIYKLEQTIKKLNNEINIINNDIINDCIKKYGKHHYEREEESGPYAESYWICKNCECEQ